MTIRWKLLSAFFLLIAIFVTVYLVNKRQSDVVLWNSEYITKSETVLRNSNLIQKQIIDMQSAYRGYLLTGQENFLVPYKTGLKNVPWYVSQQEKLLQSEGQLIRMDSILMIHQKWVAYANELIQARKESEQTTDARYNYLVQNRFNNQVGKNYNDQIKELFDEFNEHEYTVRRERKKNLQASIEYTTRVNLALVIGSLFLGFISSYIFAGGIARRINQMVALADDIARGRFRTIKERGHDEITLLAISLNTMSRTLQANFEDLTQKNRELDEFAYVVSHDLKAPLRGIDNITRWLEEDHEKDLTPDIRNSLALIKGRTSRLENLINGLLAYARIGRKKHQLENVNVGMLLLEITDLIVPRDFKVVMETSMPEIFTERILLSQVFSNLISNAVKYNDKPEGIVTIRCEEGADIYVFEVSDNGPGIEKEYHEKIFRIFQTLKERDAFESTGVGLAIVKRILDNMKMTITVHSKPGSGTTFRFTWPKKTKS